MHDTIVCITISLIVISLETSLVFAERIEDFCIYILLSIHIVLEGMFELSICIANCWVYKRLAARLPPLGSRVRVSVALCGFRGGQNVVWIGFSPDFSRLPQHKFHSTISPHSSHSFRFILFHFMSPCCSANGVVDKYLWKSQTFNIGVSITVILDPAWIGHELRRRKTNNHPRPPLWSRDNIVAYHLASPCMREKFVS